MPTVRTTEFSSSASRLPDWLHLAARDLFSLDSQHTDQQVIDAIQEHFAGWLTEPWGTGLRYGEQTFVAHVQAVQSYGVSPLMNFARAVGACLHISAVGSLVRLEFSRAAKLTALDDPDGE